MTVTFRTIGALFASIAFLAAASLQPAFAQDSAVQVKLTDAMVKNYLAAQADLKPLAAKAEAAGDKPDPALEAELETIAKKHGFASFSELDDVSFTIALLMDGFDTESGAFNEPKEQLNKELATIKADKSIPAAEKAELIADVEDVIKSTPAVQHKENFTVVKKFVDELEKVTDRD